jgi:hypothetical protein
MNLIVPWVAFPLILAALALGSGLLVERIAGRTLPPPVLLPVGLATIVTVSSLTVELQATAKLTTPLVAALAAAGLVLSRPRRPDGWALGAGLTAYVCFGAPVLASGAATFAGYVKLDDTATFLALTDRVLEHGRSLDGLAPSSYEAALSVNLAHGYPLGSLLPLGIGHELLRTDSAWLYQPWLSFCAAMLALCLYALATRLVDRRRRALVAAIAAQPALLYGFALWGGAKELAGAALVATAAALTDQPGRSVRSLLPFAIACAAVLDTLSLAGAVWLLPLAAALVPLGRRKPLVLAGGAAGLAVVSAPALAAADEFLRGANRAVFESGAELGNLIRPLHPLQLLGVWPTGDFRVEPAHRVVTAVLVAVGVCGALLGVVLAALRRAHAVLLALLSSLAGAVVFTAFGGPWVAAKALAVGAPVVLLVALVGLVGLPSTVAAVAPRRRPVALAATVLAAVALAAGVVWSNALAYHDVNLAPRSQLAELEWIGVRFAGQGPALMTEYQPYGVRHFLRDLDAEGASELRRRPIALRGGRLAGKGEYVDLDQLELSSVLVYRLLVLRRSPTESRPPAPYRLVWQGRWYRVWRRESDAAVLTHIPLGGPLEPASDVSCRRVSRLRSGGRLIAAPRPSNLIWSPGTAPLPAGWAALPGGAVIPGATGTLTQTVNLPHGGRYRLWVGGSARGTLTASVDGEQVGSVSAQLQNAGQWLDLGGVALSAGLHDVAVAVELRALEPGTGGGGFPLGPLLLEPHADGRLLEPSQPRSLCGRRLDWLEALAR